MKLLSYCSNGIRFPDKTLITSSKKTSAGKDEGEF